MQNNYIYWRLQSWFHFCHQFPPCTDDLAVSVACLELQYFVDVSVRVHFKDESDEAIAPQTLIGIELDDVDGEVAASRKS